MMQVNTVSFVSKSAIYKNLQKALQSNNYVGSNYDLNKDKVNISSCTSMNQFVEQCIQKLENYDYFDNMDDIGQVANDIRENMYVYSSDDTTSKIIHGMHDATAFLEQLAQKIDLEENRKEFKEYIYEYQNEMLHSISQTISKNMNQEAKNTLLNQLNESKMLYEQLQQNDEEVKAMKESFEILMKCLKIAMAMLSGKKVMESDQEFLMKNNPDLYKMACLLKKPTGDEEEKEISGEENKQEEQPLYEDEISNLESSITEVQSINIEM